MNEHSFVQSVHRQLKKQPDIFFWKINDRFAGGTPDSFIEGTAADLWVEFKYLKPFPKRGETIIDLTHPKLLSKNQQLWLERRHHKRGDTLVLVGSEFGTCMFPGLTWQKPITAAQFRGYALNMEELVDELLTWLLERD